MGADRHARLRKLLGALVCALCACLGMSALLGVSSVAALAGEASATTGTGSAYLAYVTGTASSQPQVWALVGPALSPAKLLGPGLEPLLAPNGALVAASVENGSSGPALALYSPAGAPTKYFGSAAAETAQPLAWSPDSKYLAVALTSTKIINIAKGSSLAVIDVETGVMTTIAHGLVLGASFAPNSDQLAYGLDRSFALGAPVNIYIAGPEGAAAHLFTHDGHSLYPVWGAEGIAFDRERLRHLYAPVFEIWIEPAVGGRARQLTRLHVSRLMSGLVPFAFSAAGTSLVASFSGEDTTGTWTVDLRSGRVRELREGSHALLTPAGISQDGTTVLVDEGSFESPPSTGRIALVPFTGGRPHVLVAHGAEASWNE